MLLYKMRSYTFQFPHTSHQNERLSVGGLLLGFLVPSLGGDTGGFVGLLEFVIVDVISVLDLDVLGGNAVFGYEILSTDCVFVLQI